MSPPDDKPRLGLFGLTGCAGDQLALLNADDFILALSQRLTIVSFDMALSRKGDWQGDLDIALVEGSVCCQRDYDLLLDIRRRCRTLVALGSCAVWGGIAAMAGKIPLAERTVTVYGDSPHAPVACEPLPLSALVTVDGAVTGCPVEAGEVAAFVATWLAGGEPRRTDWSVCAECRMAEHLCLVQQKRLVCCGPVTAGGCNARCPSYGQPCSGCRGPVDDPAWSATCQLFSSHGLDKEAVILALQRYSAPAWVARHLAPAYAADPQRRGLGQCQGRDGDERHHH